MSELSRLKLCIDSAVVEAIHDGFQVKVNAITGFDDIETACYLYDGKEVVSKSGYRNNSHVFTINSKDSISCKIFFRSKSNNSIKKSKFYPVIFDKSFRYRFSDNIFKTISYRNSEIIDTKPNAIEIYEKKGFKPRNDNLPYILKLPIDWIEDPFNDSNWMFQLHAWRMLDAYFKRNEDNDLRYIAQIINDWVAFEKKHESKWLWYDMSTGLRALKITLYLKLCHEKKLSHNIDDLDYLLHEHFKHLSNPIELNYGNHGLFQLHGLKSLAYFIESNGNYAHSMLDMRHYANEKMSELITSQLGKDGVHKEHSPDYHFFAYNKVTNIIKSPWWNDLNKDLVNILELSKYAKSWLVFPNNKCVPIGDSVASTAKENLESLDKWPNIKSGEYIGARLDGYAVVRSVKAVPVKSSSFLFFQGSFYSHTHKHCDDLSFVLQENGINILIDSGKYGYKQDKFRKYFLSTRAHNTIELDQKSTSRKQQYAYGSAILGQPECIDGIWILKGEVNHIMNEYIHKRTIIYEPGVDLYVIDKIINQKSGVPREINQWWHFDTDADICIEKNKIIVSIAHSNNIEIDSKSSNELINYQSYKGYSGTSGNLIGWVSKSYLEYEPTSTLKISTKLNKISTILTRFKLKEGLLKDRTVSLADGKIIVKNIKLILDDI